MTVGTDLLCADDFSDSRGPEAIQSRFKSNRDWDMPTTAVSIIMTVSSDTNVSEFSQTHFHW